MLDMLNLIQKQVHILMGAQKSRDQHDSDPDCEFQDSNNWLQQAYYIVKLEQIDTLNCRNIGFLLYSTPHQRLTGTAFLVSSDTIVTSAHNIYDIKRQAMRQPIYFYPAAVGQIKEQNKYEIHSVYCPQQYQNLNPRKRYDYAFLKLNRSVPQYKFMRICRNFDKNIVPQQMSIFSYPREQNLLRGTPIQGNNYIVQMKGLLVANIKQKITEINLEKGIIDHLIPTGKGSSGAPIFAKIQGQTLIVGIVKGSYQKKALNIGLLFTDNICKELKQWQQKNKASPAKFINIQPFVWTATTEVFLLQRSIEPQWQKHKITCRKDNNGSQYSRSQSILKLKSQQDTIRLSFEDIEYVKNTSCIAFGIILKYKMRDSKIETTDSLNVIYRTAIESRGNYGKISSCNRTVQDWATSLFVERGQKVEMNLNITNKIVKIKKDSNHNDNQISLPKQYEYIDVYVQVEISCAGDSIAVKCFKN